MSNMLRNKEQPLHNEGNATTLPRGVAVVLPRDWQPFAHSPRYPIVTCCGCGDRLVNESNVLRRLGWTESTSTRPRYFRCGHCSEDSE